MILLSGATLTGTLLDVLGVETAYRRDAISPMLERAIVGKGHLAKRYPTSVLQRALAWVEQMEPIVARPDETYFESLVRVQSIDPGEALLFASAADSRNQVVVATGDKRACTALAHEESLSRVRKQLKGTVLCFEGAIRLLLENSEFNTLADGLSVVRDYHQTIRILLPQGSATRREEFIEGLESYYQEVAAAFGDLLFDPLSRSR